LNGTGNKPFYGLHPRLDADGSNPEAAQLTEGQLQSLTEWLIPRAQGRPCVIGISGSQGSGKSTLALRLRETLARQAGLRVVILSIDDLYLTRAERQRLAQAVHPLLRTRGVPGTHDLGLGLRVLDELMRPAGEPVTIPRFVKTLDDRAPEAEWSTVRGPADLVLFEGWCVGTPPQNPEDLREPVNELEAREDPDGVWRRYVNMQLATAYRELFARIDQLIFLKAPDFDSIHRWRLQQERGNAAAAPQGRAMDPEQLRRFIQHYERLTRHAMQVLPERADVVIELGPEHEWLGPRLR
jgi:D-glycerate 3-kinase